jgi:mRNA interferase MazF
MTARGEVWLSALDDEWPIILLSGDDSGEYRAIQTVAPATEAQKRGFVILSPEEAEQAQGSVPGTGIEVPLGPGEGLPGPGVVRVALPDADRLYCTWQASVTRDALIERTGTLSAAKMAQLATALRLAGIE